MPIDTPRIGAIRAALSGPVSEGSSDFDLNAASPSVIPRYRPAAVLVPLVDRDDGLRVILTKRSSHLKHHPGQIAFPGGKVDDTDASPMAAALREAEEEIGLTADQVEIIGHLPTHKTVTAFEVHPFVGHVSGDFVPVPEPGEVAEVFEVPLSHLREPSNYLVEGRRWRGQRRHYYVAPFGPYYIWGATARMLRMFADRLDAA